MSTLIAITGGIGCGKSIVSRLLRVMGYAVYDCDQQAKVLMEQDKELRQALIAAFGASTYYPEGGINRPYLASRIFNDPAALERMNSLVHPAVARDLQRWHKVQDIILAKQEATLAKQQKAEQREPQDAMQIGLQTAELGGCSSTKHTCCFYESAILFESGFDSLADHIWSVSAPAELRIERCLFRDRTTREKVEARMASQLPQEEKDRRANVVIYNTPERSIIAQVRAALL
jgi:dephospho-CoA kinase